MIEILKESQENLLVVKATEKLTTKDYEETFIPTLEKILKKHEKVRVLIHLASGFKGWELGAAWDDAKFGMTHRKDFEKIAMVGGPTWVVWGTKLGAYLIKGEVKTFEEKEFKKALTWIKK